LQISPDEKRRSKVSSYALGLGNAAQVLLAIIFVGVIAGRANPNLNPSNADFESADVSAWQLTYIHPDPTWVGSPAVAPLLRSSVACPVTVC